MGPDLPRRSLLGPPPAIHLTVPQADFRSGLPQIPTIKTNGFFLTRQGPGADERLHLRTPRFSHGEMSGTSCPHSLARREGWRRQCVAAHPLLDFVARAASHPRLAGWRSAALRVEGVGRNSNFLGGLDKSRMPTLYIEASCISPPRTAEAAWFVSMGFLSFRCVVSLKRSRDGFSVFVSFPLCDTV